MRMEDAKVGMRVQMKDGKRASIESIKPGSKFNIQVLFEGALAATPWPVADVKKAALTDEEKLQRDIAEGFIKYPMDPERALRPWVFTRWYPELAWVVGYAAQANAALLHSGQPNGGRPVEDEFEFGVDSNGEKFDVVMSNPNCVGLDDILDINFIQGRTGIRQVSLNKEGFYRFLETLNFQVGREAEQNVHNVRQSIPAEYLADFDAGTRGSTTLVL